MHEYSCFGRWFHGQMSREDAATALTGTAVGTFLVRQSTTIETDYTISVVLPSGIKHFKVGLCVQVFVAGVLDWFSCR